MRIVGLIAEYNPFHTGHQYHITEIRRSLGEDTPVIAVMSGNWVQRGECAIADKWQRAAWAVCGGVDLVLDLPTSFACASAERFARGGVSLLMATGLVDTISFGSEQGDVTQLTAVARCLDSEQYREALHLLLQQHTLPFAVCRQKAVAQILGDHAASLLASPNNTLAVEYIRAAGTALTPLAIRRRGVGHDDIDPADGFASASAIRRQIQSGAAASAAPFLPTAWPLDCPIADITWGERALLATLRTMTAEQWSALPDSAAEEGLPMRLVRAGLQAQSLSQFYDLAKTRRYTHARLRRLVIWAFLNLNNDSAPHMLRVLAFSDRGRQLLAQMRHTATSPIITKPAQIPNTGAAKRQFEQECRCTDLYGLFFQTPRCTGLEWTTTPFYLQGGGT